MWRRVSVQLHAFAPWRSSSQIHRPAAVSNAMRSGSISAIRRAARYYAVQSGSAPPINQVRFGDIKPTATGRKVEDGDVLEIRFKDKKPVYADASVGSFGTKESPAVIKSSCDKALVGCTGGGGDQMHEIVWLSMEKRNNPHECPVCSQILVLEIVDTGGPPQGHGDKPKQKHTIKCG